jgi:hypothetical protein
MSLTDYTIEDLKYLLEAVLDTKRKTANPYKESAMLQFEVDIEQAIKNKEFAEQLARKDNDFEANTTLTPIE